MNSNFRLIEEGRHILSSVRLSDFFNRPVVVEDNGNLDHLTRGLATQSQEEVDPFFTSEVRNVYMNYILVSNLIKLYK